MYKVIFNFIKNNYSKKIIILVINMVTVVFLEMLGVGLIIPIISLLSSSEPIWVNKYISIDNNTNALYIFLVIIVFVYLLKSVFMIYSSYYSSKFIAMMQRDISERLYDIYLHQNYSFHTITHSSEINRNINSETNSFSGVLTSTSILIAESLVLIGLTSMLLYYEPIGSILVISIIFMLSFIFLKYSKKFINLWGSNREYYEKIKHKNVQQVFSSIKDIKLFQKEGFFYGIYVDANIKASTASMYQNTLQQIPKIWLELVAIISIISLVFVMLFIGNPINEILPIIGLFGLVAFRIIPSTNRIITSLQSIKYGKSVVQNITNSLKLICNTHDIKNLKIIDYHINSIELVVKRFSYPSSDTIVLRDVDLNIYAGDVIGIIGESGSGKSTLIDLLNGLYNISHGSISINGNKIHNKYRISPNIIGYVPQFIHLFDESVKSNIAFGINTSEIDYSRLHNAIKNSNLEDLVNSLPDGVDTYIGEQGVRLSGGQRQRLGIARALYNNPQVLILDEATSALDEATERQIMSEVVNLKSIEIIIVITHRSSSLIHCNKIYEISMGRIEKK